MVAWTASRNGIHLPTLSDTLLLNTEMGKMVILVSKTFESWSIRDSSFSTRSCYVTEVMIGSMVVIKNTGNEWKWCAVDVLLRCIEKWWLCQGFNGSTFKIK